MYENWFQLVQRPFGSAPDGKLYFPSHGTEAARSAMTRCIERGGGPGLVIGPAGVGKTTLALKLIDQFRAQVPVAYLSGRGILSRRELLQTLLFELGLPYGQDEGELRLQLIDVLTSTDASQRRTLLICDDADELSAELLGEISAVSNLTTDGFWSADVVLFGTLKLEEALNLPANGSFANRVAAKFYLHPFDLDETESYLQFQLQHIAGCRDSIFTPEAVQAVWQTTGGFARTINQLCDHALVLAMSNGEKRIGAEAVQQAWLDLQQLPAPERSELPESQDEFIEFGSLEDASPPEPEVDPEVGNKQKADRGEEAPQTEGQPEPLVHGVNVNSLLFPDVALDNIERQVAEIVEVHAPSRAPAGDDDPVAWLASNPFLESFDEEEVVLDLPLGICTVPPSASLKRTLADAEEEEQLLDALLMQMSELERRSLQLEQSLVATQHELEMARADSQPTDVEATRTGVCEATCGGDVAIRDQSTRSPEPYYSVDLVAVKPEDAHTHLDDLPPVDLEQDTLVNFAQTHPQVQVQMTEEVTPCESIDLGPVLAKPDASPAEDPRVETARVSAAVAQDTPQATPDEHERKAEEAPIQVGAYEPEPACEQADPEPLELDKAPPSPGSPATSRQDTTSKHGAESWPPPRKKRYQSLFSDLRRK